MRLYYWMDEDNSEEFDKVPEEQNFLGLEPNEKATPIAIRDYYNFLVECDDDTNMVIHDARELSKRMIERFKASKCYMLKSEQDRKKIIEFLRSDPGARINSTNEIIF